MSSLLQSEETNLEPGFKNGKMTTSDLFLHDRIKIVENRQRARAWCVEKQ